jgi:hypothetical protein
MASLLDPIPRCTAQVSDTTRQSGGVGTRQAAFDRIGEFPSAWRGWCNSVPSEVSRNFVPCLESGKYNQFVYSVRLGRFRLCQPAPPKRRQIPWRCCQGKWPRLNGLPDPWGQEAAPSRRAAPLNRKRILPRRGRGASEPGDRMTASRFKRRGSPRRKDNRASFRTRGPMLA